MLENVEKLQEYLRRWAESLRKELEIVRNTPGKEWLEGYMEGKISECLRIASLLDDI